MLQQEIFPSTQLLESSLLNESNDNIMAYLYTSYQHELEEMIKADLLNIDLNHTLSEIICRTFEIIIDVSRKGKYWSYFSYINNLNGKKRIDSLKSIARIICLEKIGQRTKLYESFVTQLVKEEIVHKKWIYFFSKQDCSNEQAKDLFQNSFLVLNTLFQTETPENCIFNIKPIYKGQANLTSYLYAIGKNKWKDELKKTNRYTSSKLEELDIPDNFQIEILEGIVRKDEYEHELGLIEKLDEKCKDVLLFFAQGFSQQETIILLRKKGFNFENNNSLKQQRHRCKQALLQIIEKKKNQDHGK